MRRILRVIATALAILCLAVGFALGANRGWTKTTRARMAKDPVTDLDYPVIEKHFSPGIEVLGIGLLVATTTRTRRPRSGFCSSLSRGL